MKFSLIVALIVFLVVFFGLLSVVGNVHVAEFYAALVLGVIAGMYTLIKLPKDAEERLKNL